MKKLIWIIISIVVVLLLFFFIFNSPKAETNSSAKEGQKIQQQEGTVKLDSYSDIQTSDDVFNQIDGAVDFIE